MTAEQLVAILGGFAALLVGLAAVLQQLASLRKGINGRLSQLLELTASASHAAGDLEGRRAVESHIASGHLVSRRGARLIHPNQDDEPAV